MAEGDGEFNPSAMALASAKKRMTMTAYNPVEAGKIKLAEKMAADKRKSIKPKANTFGYDPLRGREIFTGAPMVPSSTPLGARVMALEGNTSSLKKLIKTSFELCDNSNELGNSPLLFACQAGEVDCARELLLQRATVRLQNRAGVSPLHMAASQGHRACTELLLETIRSLAVTRTRMEGGGADMWEKRLRQDVDRADRAGSTPLIMAALNGHEVTCRLLVNANAAVDLPSRSYLTPLAAARFRGHDAVADVLYDAGARDPPSIADLARWG